jgi:hypothetical protein
MEIKIEQRGTFLRGPVLVALLSAMALLGLYVGILTIANSPDHAVKQFVLLWPWFSALTIGFGIQTGLFSYVRRLHKIRHLSGAASTKAITATGGISTAAMAACCTHHLSDVFPLIGLSGAALFFSDYQKIFLLLGVFSNIVGITLMLHMMQKHGLMKTGHPYFEKLSRWNMGKVFRWNAGLSTAVFAVFAMIEFYKRHF